MASLVSAHCLASSHGPTRRAASSVLSDPHATVVGIEEIEGGIDVTHTAWDLVVRKCSTCGEQRAFEAMVCADGHGADCLELACVECGEALFVGVLDLGSAAEIPAHVAAAA